MVRRSLASQIFVVGGRSAQMYPACLWSHAPCHNGVRASMKTSNRVFESPRRFVLFSYSAGHGLLLLRSRKTTETPTRVDILVQDVRAMEIRAWFDGIRIDEVGADYLGAFQSNPQEMMEKGNRIYSLTGSNWQGFIVGGIISTFEDDCDFMAPSGLLSKANQQPITN
jgi:hypothetical protein